MHMGLHDALRDRMCGAYAYNLQVEHELTGIPGGPMGSNRAPGGFMPGRPGRCIPDLPAKRGSSGPTCMPPDLPMPPGKGS